MADDMDSRNNMTSHVCWKVLGCIPVGMLYNVEHYRAGAAGPSHKQVPLTARPLEVLSPPTPTVRTVVRYYLR